MICFLEILVTHQADIIVISHIAGLFSLLDGKRLTESFIGVVT